MFKPLTTPVLATLLAAPLTAQAAVPATLPFQGRLILQAGGNAKGAHSLAFRIYATTTGGTALWSETQPSVSITNGLFKTELGSVKGFPPNLFDGSNRYLSIQVNNDAEMTPRIPLTSQAYAKMAGNATDVKDRDIHPRSVSAREALHRPRGEDRPHGVAGS